MKKYLMILAIGMMACHATKNATTTVTEKAPEVSPELRMAQAKVPGITMERIEHGNKLYVADCGKCHALKEPGNYTMERWDPILKKMYVKAKITDEADQAAIRDYVMAKSK